MSGDLRNQKNQLIDQKISSAPNALPAAKTPKKSEYHDDYDQIHAAVQETKRGRWFLGEFARKNKIVESQLVLDALAKIEDKISQNAIATKPLAKSAETKPKTAEPIVTTPIVADPIATKKVVTEPNVVDPHVANPKAAGLSVDFETKQQSSHFGQLFANFKHTTTLGLKWAGIKTAIDFSKIHTIINFATFQSRTGIQKQTKSINNLIVDLQTQNIDPIIVKKLSHIASELNKLNELQSHLNTQLEDGLKFMAEVEKIAQNLAPDFTSFTPKIAEKPPENSLKTLENDQKTAKNSQKTTEIKPKTPIIEPKTEPMAATKLKLGPAGRIKKMFKIEQTLNTQIAEDLVEPAKAFDEAFATERLQVEQDLQPDILILEQADIISQRENKTKIAEQSEKLATIGDMMKQVDAIKNNAPKNINTEPEIIIENNFNALNSLALLSKVERTMLFTLQN